MCMYVPGTTVMYIHTYTYATSQKYMFDIE